MAKPTTDSPVSDYTMVVRVGSCTGWLLVIAAVPDLCSLHEMIEWTRHYKHISVCSFSCSNSRTTDISSAKCATVVTMTVSFLLPSHTVVYNWNSVPRTRFGVHRRQSATPVRYDHDVWASNVTWSTPTPGTRDATGSALGLYALTLCSNLEDYCFSELSYANCAVCFS
jgi:hypothetical protein